MSQLPLPIKLDDSAIFETFLADGNESLVGYLEALSASPTAPGAWLWGRAASGKSHLLQAVCERSSGDAVFLPLRELATAGPEVLDGMAERQCVCLDDVDEVARHAEWERGLFRLFVRVTEHQSALVVSSSGAQRESGFVLADLASRFSLLPSFQLQPLGDDGRIKALKLRAAHRGLDLPDDTAQFLAARARRDMASLYALLDRLDHEALVAQRRLTIPFVKGVLKQQ